MTEGCVVRIERCGGTVVARFRGVLCEDSASLASSWLAMALLLRPQRVMVDLADVDLLCAAGVRSLVTARHWAVGSGVAFELRHPRRHVRWVLVLCGLDPALSAEGRCSRHDAGRGWRPRPVRRSRTASGSAAGR